MAPPVITITRQYASGGAAVARQVAAALAWTVIDNEFVDEVARRAGLAPATVAEPTPRAPPPWPARAPPGAPPRPRTRCRGGAPGGARAGHGGGARGAGSGPPGAAGPHARRGLAGDVHHVGCRAARRAGRNDDREAHRADHRGGGGPWARGAGRAGGAGAAGAAAGRVARLRRGIETVARQTRRGAAGRGPRQRREGGGRHGPWARPVRADLLRAAPPRRRELRPRRQHRAAGHRGRGGAGRGGSAPATVAMNTVGRSVALLASLAGCFHGAVAPPAAVAVMPFDPYGGAIYVPAIVNDDSAWLMFDTGLSHTGLDRDWAKSVGATPATDTSATAVVRSFRLGDLHLDGYRTTLSPLGGLSEASG